MPSYSKAQIRKARQADLYAFLQSNFPSEYKHEGNSIRPKFNPSISIKQGYSGYVDFATGEKGNSLDYLKKYHNMTFVEAVRALIGDTSDTSSTAQPQPTSWEPSILIQTVPLVQYLIDEKAIYQEADHNNIVFVSQNFAELHGSLTGSHFHGVAISSSPTGFWWFRPFDHAERAYVCEAAIDAMSLFTYRRYRHIQAQIARDWHGVDEFGSPAMYASIAGVANYQRVDAIIAGMGQRYVFLSADNDEAGKRLCERYSNNRRVRQYSPPPEYKDWNEYLCASVDAFSGIEFTMP